MPLDIKSAKLYEVFEPQEARRIVRKLELHHPPKQGSWVVMAEIEISVLDRQCLDRHLAEVPIVHSEVQSWEILHID